MLDLYRFYSKMEIIFSLPNNSFASRGRIQLDQESVIQETVQPLQVDEIQKFFRMSLANTKRITKQGRELISPRKPWRTM